MNNGDDLATDEPLDEAAGDSREAWLELARTDVDCGAAALATAARHGRPLPPREPAS